MGKLRLFIQDEPFNFPVELVSHPGVETWPDPYGREYGFGLPHGEEYWMKVHGVGSFVVQQGYWDVIGFPDRGVNPASFQDAFFHGVAPWLLQRRDWDCLHGSAVLTGRGVVVFCGHTRRGKSTLARACVECGAIPYADDAVPFVVRDDAALCGRIPQRISLREPAASRFSPLPRIDSAQAFENEIFYDLEPTLRPMRGIYWLDPVAHAAGRLPAVITPIPSVEALPLLLSVAHCMSLRDPDCNRKMVRNYLSLVRLQPVHRLQFVLDLDLLPAVLDRLEER